MVWFHCGQRREAIWPFAASNEGRSNGYPLKVLGIFRELLEGPVLAFSRRKLLATLVER